MINGFRKRDRSRKLNEISLTPLIDVALTLLVALMIAMPASQNAIKIALPKGTVNEHNAQGSKLIVNIDAENNLYLNNQKLELNQLLLEIIDKSKQFDGNVFLKADASVNYGFLMKVIDSIKSLHGVSNVVLLTSRM